MDGKQIFRELINLKGFLGVFSIDTLPAVIPPGVAAVVNLDHSTGRGTHWVALFRSAKGLEYFDPLGRPPPEALPWSGFVLYNRKKLQHPLSLTCGRFVVHFVKRRLSGENFASIIQSYSNNTLLNDLL